MPDPKRPGSDGVIGGPRRLGRGQRADVEQGPIDRPRAGGLGDRVEQGGLAEQVGERSGERRAVRGGRNGLAEVGVDVVGRGLLAGDVPPGEVAVVTPSQPPVVQAPQEVAEGEHGHAPGPGAGGARRSATNRARSRTRRACSWTAK